MRIDANFLKSCQLILYLEFAQFRNFSQELNTEQILSFYRVESFFVTETSQKITEKLVFKLFCVCLSFVLLRIVKSSSRLLCRIETLFQSSPSLVDNVKPFAAAVVTTINQKQYSSSYILISSNASPFLKRVTLMGSRQ